MPSSPLLLLWSGVWEGPSCLPLLISLASLLCPQGPTQPGVGFGGQRIGLGAQQSPWARLGGVVALQLFSCSSRRAPPACHSQSLWPQEHQSCLTFNSPHPSVSLHLTVSLWGSFHLLRLQSSPPVASKCSSCGEMLTLCLPTLPT